MTTNTKLQEIARQIWQTCDDSTLSSGEAIQKTEQIIQEYSAELEKSCIEWATSHGKLQAEHLKVTEERDSSLIREKVLRDALDFVLQNGQDYKSSTSKFWEMLNSIRDNQPPTNLIVVDKAEWERYQQMISLPKNRTCLPK